MSPRTLRLDEQAPFVRLIGVGGIGSGMFLALEGDHTLGRNESRPGRLLNVRDYCKLHIIAHHVAVLLGADPSGDPFHVVALGKVGDDDTGRRLTAEMGSAGIDTRYVEAVRERPTLFSVCFQYPDGEGGNITTVDSAAAALGPEDVDRVGPLLASAGPRTIALAAPEVPIPARRRLLELATGHGAFRVASFTSSEIAEARASGIFAAIDLISLNEDEAAAVADLALDPADPAPFLERCASTLAAEHAGIAILVSAGVSGVFAFSDGRWQRRGALLVPVESTAGAGDALLAGVIAALAAGVPFIDSDVRDDDTRLLTSALDLGVLLASLSVTSRHTIHPSADLPALLELADELGLGVGGRLAEVI